MKIDWKMVVSVMVGVVLANLAQPFVNRFLPQG